MSLSVNRSITLHRYLWVLILLSIIAYCSPWIVNKSVGLSLGAYDLAEWASLHPGSRMNNPVLLVSLFLRLPLVILALIVSFTARTNTSRAWWLRAGFGLGIALALLPPLEYLARPSGDANYGQQLGLSAIVFVGSLIGLSRCFRDLIFPLNILWGLLGIVVTLTGLFQAHDLMRQFDLSAQIGFGALVLVGIFGLIVIANWRPGLRGINQTR